MASAMVDGWVRADPARASRIVVSDRGSGRAGRLAELHGVARRGFEPRARRARGHRDRRGQADRRRARAARGVGSDHARARGAVGRRRRRDDDARDDRRRGRPGVPRHAERRRARVRRHARASPRAGSQAGTPRQHVLEWLALLGTVVRLEERLFDAATALAGSGPAFLGLVIEAFEDAGIVSGLSAAKARELILSTMVGHRGAARRVRDVVLRSAPHRHLTRRHRSRRASPRWSAPGCGAASSTACSRRCDGRPELG